MPRDHRNISPTTREPKRGENLNTRHIITGLLPALCLLGCSTTVPATPSSGPAQPSPISNNDPQPSGEITGAELKGTVLDENGEPIEGCLIAVKGDTREMAIVTDASGMFSVGFHRNSQRSIIINCEKHQIYQKEEFPVQVPETDEFEQTFTVHRK